MVPIYKKCDKSITIPQLKTILEHQKVQFKKSAKKEELCRLVEKCLKKGSQSSVVSPKQSKTQKQTSSLSQYKKCDKSITIAQLKKLLDKYKAEYKKSAKKEELCRLVEKCLKKGVQLTSTPKPLQKQRSPVVPVYTKCDKSINIDKLKKILDHHKIQYKKSSKKNDLCLLVENFLKKDKMSQPLQKQKVQLGEKNKTKESSKIYLNKTLFEKKKMLDLGILGKYRCVPDEGGKNIVLHLISNQKTRPVPKSRQSKPKLVNIMDGDSILVDDLEVGDLVNLGDYRLFYGYFVNTDKQGHLSLSPIMAEEDKSIIPFYVTELWKNPVKAYEDIDDIDALEMVLPHPFLEDQFGLEPKHKDQLKNVIFEYSTSTGDLDIMLDDGRNAFTLEPGEAEGEDLVSLIKKELKL